MRGRCLEPGYLDCKSAGVCLRGFESCTCYQPKSSSELGFLAGGADSGGVQLSTAGVARSGEKRSLE